VAWDEFLYAPVIAALPSVIIAFVFQCHIVAELTAGSVKG